MSDWYGKKRQEQPEPVQSLRPDELSLSLSDTEQDGRWRKGADDPRLLDRGMIGYEEVERVPEYRSEPHSKTVQGTVVSG